MRRFTSSSRGGAVALALGILGFGLVASAAVADGKIAYSEKIRIEPVPVDVELWTDKGRGADYCVGEEIEIFFRTDADAYVAVFDTDTRGRTHRLFPNRWDRDHFVRGHKTYRLPDRGYRFLVEGPPGVETLHVIAAPTRGELREAVDALIYERGAYPASHSYEGETRNGYRNAPRKIAAHKIATVPDGVAYAVAEHRVTDRRACYPPRPRHRPWWRR